jgi:hypothetical protein
MIHAKYKDYFLGIFKKMLNHAMFLFFCVFFIKMQTLFFLDTWPYAI